MKLGREWGYIIIELMNYSLNIYEITLHMHLQYKYSKDIMFLKSVSLDIICSGEVENHIYFFCKDSLVQHVFDQIIGLPYGTYVY